MGLYLGIKHSNAPNIWQVAHHPVSLLHHLCSILHLQVQQMGLYLGIKQDEDPYS
jgi:hypothetical protein